MECIIFKSVFQYIAMTSFVRINKRKAFVYSKQFNFINSALQFRIIRFELQTHFK